MSYFEDIPRPKILLINHTTNESNRFIEAGYTVDNAYIGKVEYIHPKALLIARHYHLPKPPYEYDIFIVNTEMPKEGNQYKYDHGVNITSDISLISEQVTHKKTSFVIGYLGESTVIYNNHLWIFGLPLFSEEPADIRDSDLEIGGPNTFNIPALDKIIIENKNSISAVKQYISRPDELYSKLGVYPNTLLYNKKGKKVGEYAIKYSLGDESQNNLCYFLLPQFKDHVKISLSILEVAAELMPHMFTVSKIQYWIDRPEFTFPEVKNLKGQIDEKTADFNKFCEETNKKNRKKRN